MFRDKVQVYFVEQITQLIHCGNTRSTRDCILSRIAQREMQLKGKRCGLNGRISAKNVLCVKRAQIFFYKSIYGKMDVSKQSWTNDSSNSCIENMLDRYAMEHGICKAYARCRTLLRKYKFNSIIFNLWLKAKLIFV